MPVLQDIKWERFANAIAAGATQAEAYKSSGYRGKQVDSNASHIAKNPRVAARIKELIARVERRSTAAAVSRAAVDKEYVLRRLQDNLELHFGKAGGGAVVNRAAELLGKHLGMFQDLPPAGPPRLEDLSTEDLERMLGREPGSTIAGAASGSLANPSPATQFEEIPGSLDGSKSTQ